MVQAQTRALALEAFLELPETKPASEYIDGQIIQKPMPQGKHSTLQLDFATVINAAVKPKKIARAFTELRCTFGGASIVPDITVMTWEQIPVDNSGEISNVFLQAPNWSIEILSPNQSSTKINQKIHRCLQYGSRMCWTIDPAADKSVTVYRPNQSFEILTAPEAKLPMPDFMHELTFTFKDLFDLLLL